MLKTQWATRRRQLTSTTCCASSQVVPYGIIVDLDIPVFPLVFAVSSPIVDPVLVVYLHPSLRFDQCCCQDLFKQESPAIADKPARRESLPKLLQFDVPTTLSLTWPVFMRLTAVASEIREIPRNSLKIQIYGVQGHRRSSILVSIESPYVTSY